MKIVHHETVKHLVHDPNSHTGLKEITEHRLSNTSTISVPGETEDAEPQVFTKSDDGTFDVPDEVGAYFTRGTHGAGFPGWSVWTGEPLSASPDRLAELERRIAELSANGGDPEAVKAAEARAAAAEARVAELEAAAKTAEDEGE